RAGAVVGLRGESPYDVARVRGLVAGQYPDDARLQKNCGFFLPPMAVLVFAPFAAVPWPAAKVLYAILTGLAVLAVGLLPRLWRPSDDPPPGPPVVWLGLPLLVALNPLTLAVGIV